MVLLDTENPGTSREIYSEDDDCERNSQPLDYKPSALAIELYSSKAVAGKELSLYSWCIASLYIYHFSTVTDFSPGSTVVLLDTEIPATSREIYIKDDDGETRICNYWMTNPVL